MGSRILEFVSWILDPGFLQILDFGVWILNPGFGIFDILVLDVGFLQILDFGICVLDLGSWIFANLGFGDFGCWSFDWYCFFAPESEDVTAGSTLL